MRQRGTEAPEVRRHVEVAEATDVDLVRFRVVAISA